jgi:hypothetical protein
MISSQDIFGNLSADEVQRTLSSCYLLEKSEYTDDERHIFHECRSLIEQGKSDEELSQHFAYRKDESSANSPKSESKSKKSAKSKSLSLFELKAVISDLIGSKISLADILRLVEASGLEEKETYTQSECDRMIETISKSRDSGDGDINATIQGLSIASQEGFAKLVDRVTDKLAESAPDAFNQIYLQKIAANMTANQQQIRDFYNQLEETIIAELEGKKSPLQMLIDSHTRPSLFSMKSAVSLPESSSDTTIS